MKRYTAEMLAFLRQHRASMDENQLAKAFNKTFGMATTGKHLAQTCRNHGIYAKEIAEAKPSRPLSTKQQHDSVTIGQAAEQLDASVKTLRVLAKDLAPVGKTFNSGKLYSFAQLKDIWRAHQDQKLDNQAWVVPQHTARETRNCLLHRRINQLINTTLTRAS